MSESGWHGASSSSFADHSIPVSVPVPGVLGVDTGSVVAEASGKSGSARLEAGVEFDALIDGHILLFVRDNDNQGVIVFSLI